MKPISFRCPTCGEPTIRKGPRRHDCEQCFTLLVVHNDGFVSVLPDGKPSRQVRLEAIERL